MVKKKGRSKSRLSSRISVVATSPKGISHEIDDLDAFEKQTQEYEQRRTEKERKDLAESKRFFTWLSAQAPLPFGADVKWTGPFYRVVWKPVPVLSVAGSLGSGGRFNLGAAQTTTHFSIREEACLYVSSSIPCCLAEIQAPAGPPDKYELHPKKEFVLWDLSKVLQHFNDPVVLARVKDAPLDAIWKLQKIPLTPQLLAHHLRSLGGDGILFPSTKVAGAYNIALFFRFDNDVKAALEAIQI